MSEGMDVYLSGSDVMDINITIFLVSTEMPIRDILGRLRNFASENFTIDVKFLYKYRLLNHAIISCYF